MKGSVIALDKLVFPDGDIFQGSWRRVKQGLDGQRGYALPLGQDLSRRKWSTNWECLLFWCIHIAITYASDGRYALLVL